MKIKHFRCQYQDFNENYKVKFMYNDSIKLELECDSA